MNQSQVKNSENALSFVSEQKKFGLAQAIDN